MSNNTLSGTIPPEYSQPPVLKDLWLDGNKLTGTVPAIGADELQNLNEFLLQENALVGTMPDSICALATGNGNLEDLFSDCGGVAPEIECPFPECCNRCFEFGVVAQRRRMQMLAAPLPGFR